MDDYDRQNLSFLLNADKETLADWYSNVSEDDHEYAAELLLEYGEELKIATTLLEDKIIDDLSDAGSIIRKFRL